MEAKEKTWIGKLLVTTLVLTLVLGVMPIYAQSYSGGSSSGNIENVTKELSVEITNPEDGETVSGIVKIKAEASGENELKEMKFVIIKGKGPWILKEIKPRCEFTTSDRKHMYCKGKLDSSEINISYISIVAMVWDVNNNYAEDSIGVYINKNVTKELSVEITNPEDGETVSGIVKIKATANGPNKLEKMSLTITGEHRAKYFLLTDCIESVSKPIGGVTHESYTKTCWYDWDTSDYVGEKVTLTASITDVEGNRASDSVSVYVAEETEPKEKATLRVKAYDVETGDVVKDATTIVLKYLSEPVRKLMTEPVEVPIGRKEPNSGGGVAEPAIEKEVRAEEEWKEKERKAREEWKEKKIYISGPKIVVRTLKADSIDSIEIEPGTYELITYAINYTLHTNYRIKIEAGKEYNLYAPLSKGKIIKIPEKREIKPITVKTGKLVEVVPEVKDIEVEVIPTTEIRKISIRPAKEIGKSILESGKVEATTSEEIEIEEGKLYTKTNETKKQVKVLPATASERAREAVKMHKIKDIELVVVDKRPVYIVEGEQEAKLFGFIPTKINTTVEISGEDGEVVKIIKPWWSSLAIANK